MSRRITAAGLLALACLALPACGGGEDQFLFEVHPVDGKVTAKGQPVPGAIVRFHPADPAALAVPEGSDAPAVMLTTETDADGAFVMSTYLAGDGMPAGDYAVTVATTDPAAPDVENSDGPVAKAPRRAAKAAAPKMYRDPATTPLKATVQPGENHFEFELD